MDDRFRPTSALPGKLANDRKAATPVIRNDRVQRRSKAVRCNEGLDLITLEPDVHFSFNILPLRY
ncbi:MAG: hypothetical protein WBQ78_07420, partial [Gammaproteobacteria bacterium]